MADPAFLLPNPVLLTEQVRGGSRCGSFLQLGIAEEALVLVQRVLFAICPARVHELGMAQPAAILVTVVLGAPQPALFTQARVADEAEILRRAVPGARRGRR